MDLTGTSIPEKRYWFLPFVLSFNKELIQLDFQKDLTKLYFQDMKEPFWKFNWIFNWNIKSFCCLLDFQFFQKL